MPLALARLQAYYKLSYVDRRVANLEQRICEDIPCLAEGLGDLLREWCNASVDALFYAWMLRRYSRTNKYTAAIVGYVLGAGVLTTLASPNFGRLYKRQSENEGAPLTSAFTSHLMHRLLCIAHSPTPVTAVILWSGSLLVKCLT